MKSVLKTGYTFGEPCRDSPGEPGWNRWIRYDKPGCLDDRDRSVGRSKDIREPNADSMHVVSNLQRDFRDQGRPNDENEMMDSPFESYMILRLA